MKKSSVALTALLVAACGSPDTSENASVVEQASNLGSASPSPVCPATTTLATNVKPTSIAVDATQVFFSQSSPISSTAVGKVPIGGGAVTNIVTDFNGAASATVAGSYVYWLRPATSQLYRAPTAGGATELIATRATAVHTIQNQALSVRVSSGPFPITDVYWAHYDESVILKLRRTSVAPGWTTTTITTPGSAPSNLPWLPFTLTTDANQAYLGRINEAVLSVPLTGGQGNFITIDAVDNGPIATDGTYVYSNNGTSIARTSVTGLGGTDVFEAGVGAVGAFAIDATHLYWTSKSSGFIKKKPLAGGSAVTLTCAQTSPLAIAVDSTYVYFGTSNALKRRPK